MGKAVRKRSMTYLIPSNVDERHTRTVSTTLTDFFKVSIEELGARNFETLFDNLRGELVGTVLCCIAKDVFDSTGLVRTCTVLADMLDTPIAELAVRNNIDAAKDFVDAGTLENIVINEAGHQNQETYLIFFQAVLENVLYNQTSGFTESHFMPHTTQSFVDILHDLRRRVTPAKLKQLLPDMASVSMDDSLGNTTKKLVNHDSLAIFWHNVKSFLYNMAAEGIHAELQGVASDGIGNGDNLLGCAMFEATLNEKVTKAVDHELVSLGDNGLNKLKLLLWRRHFQFLLQEDGCLLVVADNNLVDNVLPVAVHAAVEEAAVIERFHGRDIA